MKICRDFEVGKTIYEYECSKCGFNEDLYYHMDEERPDTYMCPKCEEETMRRIFGNKQIHIPPEWSTTDNKFDFSKGPSGRKHFY
jgi:putative FmdB family regulatory protein